MEVQGLICVEDFITEEKEAELLEEIDSREWSDQLKRRVQHYGYEYNYKSSRAKWIGDLPQFLPSVRDLVSEMPNQVIINEYLPGQGISAHIDKVPLFGKEIVTLSLGSDCVMVFSWKGIDKKVLLKRRSVVVLKEDARYKWTHSIPQQKRDYIGTNVIERSRRVSVTFRRVIH